MKKTTKILLTSVIACAMLGPIFAQQQAQFTQYMDNMLYYNPAYAGSHDALSMSALHRQQWVGFDGAPMSTTFSLHTPLRYENLGIGLSFLNDKLGPTNDTWVNADISYSLRFKGSGRLSFGVNGGINLLNGNLIKLEKMDAGDQTLNVQYQNEIKPNFGAGIYYHSDQWFIGFAIPHILDNTKDIGSVLNTEFISQRHYYFMVGGYINASRMLKIRPSAMFKMTENAPFALDASLAFIFYDKFWVGGNYRLLESAGIFVQYQISHQFKIGYAFEFSTTKLRGHNAGTHELMLSYDLLFRGKSIASPRYF